MFNTDAVDAFYLRPSSTPCFDLSADIHSLTFARRGSLPRYDDSHRGPSESYAYVRSGEGSRTSYNSTTATRPYQPQHSFRNSNKRREEAIEPEGVPYNSINSYLCYSTTPATPWLATATGGAVHSPAAYRRASASLPIAGSGVWERADYLPRACRTCSATASPASGTRFHSARRPTVITTVPFAGGAGAHKRCGADGSRACGSAETTMLAVARKAAPGLGTGSGHQLSSASPSAPSAAPSAVYGRNAYGSGNDGCRQALPHPAPHFPLTLDSSSQKVMEHPFSPSVFLAAPNHMATRYSSEGLRGARRGAAVNSDSGATSSANAQRREPCLQPASSSTQKRITTTVLEQGGEGRTPIAATPPRPTRWGAGEPSPPASVASAFPDESSLMRKGADARIARSTVRPLSCKSSPTVAEQDPRGSEADAAARDGRKGASAWWTVDIVITNVPCHCHSTSEEAAAMKASARMQLPADMRALRSIQCRAPVLPADASADEAWDMTQSFLRCMALASIGTSSPPCVPQGFFYFDTDFHQYVQLSADTLPVTSTLFRVVMVTAVVDTAVTEGGPAKHAEVPDATADEAQEVLLSRPCPTTRHRDLLARATPPCDHLDVAVIAPHPPRGHPSLVTRHGARLSVQPRSLEGATSPPLPSQPSKVARSVSRHRSAFDESSSRDRHCTPVEEMSPYPRRPRRPYDTVAHVGSGEDMMYPARLYGMESDTCSALCGAASPPALPTSHRIRAQGRCASDGLAAWEGAQNAGDGRYGNRGVVYIEDGETVLQAEAGEGVREASLRAAIAAERQLSRGDDCSSISNLDSISRLQCFRNAPPSSKSLTRPSPSHTTTQGLPTRVGGDSRDPRQRPPTVPEEGHSRVGIVTAMQRPSPPTLPASTIQPPSPQLFFDDPFLQRHFESPFKQSSTSSPQRAAGNTESCRGRRLIHVPSTLCTAPAPPSPPPAPPPHGAYRPVAHPYFSPSSSTASPVLGSAPTPLPAHMLRRRQQERGIARSAAP
ncbi:hypothetical protein JIQ42_05141 [Leishmania sp. Namibia]|uniref:hypothetical protein n=1 Tax=Leishmania sp. Namibia TaxID=2802991 RepID=UPI001B5B6190|nr:hypothetical protein JIQ42_05141 [Leishmania sp. Namibia]